MLQPAPNRCTQMSGDAIAKLLKQNIRVSSSKLYHPANIQCRTETSCMETKPNDYWTTNFHRRQENLVKGFYSSISEPYKIIGGDLVLDPLELVTSTLTGTAKKKMQESKSRRGTQFYSGYKPLIPTADGKGKKTYTGSDRRDTTSPELIYIAQPSTSKPTSELETSRSSIDVEAIDDSAGYVEIKKLINDYRCRIIKVQAGGSYEEKVRLEEEKRNAEKELDAKEKPGMEIISVSSCLCLPTISITGYEPQSTEWKSVTGSNIDQEIPTKSPLELDTEIITGLNQKKRQLRNYLLYLKAIYTMLTALHNMRLKDIRSRVPLCKEYVERLQKDVHIHPKEDKGAPTRPRYSLSPLAVSTDRAPYENWEDFLNMQPPEDKDDSPLRAAMLSKFVKYFGFNERASDKSGLTNPADVQAQCLVPDKPGPGSMVPDKPGPGSTVEAKRSCIHHHTGSVTGQVEKVPTDRSGSKRLPIWQQVANEKLTGFMKQKKSVSHETAVLRNRKELNKLRLFMKRETTIELERFVRKRVANFRMKYNAIGKVTMYELHGEVGQTEKDVAMLSHLEDLLGQPSKWYEELEEETISLLSSFDQSEITKVLRKIKIYAHMDHKTVQFAKAKLCLLMMSLPAYSICQICVQQALKYIFEIILLGPKTQFEEWLEYRNLPYVLLSNTSSRTDTNTM